MGLFLGLIKAGPRSFIAHSIFFMPANKHLLIRDACLKRSGSAYAKHLGCLSQQGLGNSSQAVCCCHHTLWLNVRGS